MVQITKLQLSGLTCRACEKVISKRLQKIEGVQDVYISSQKEVASITASRIILKEEVATVLEGTHYKVINNL